MEGDLVDFQVTMIELLNDNGSESSESSGLLSSAENTLPASGEAEHAENWLTDDSGLQPTGDNWRPTNGQSGSLFDVKLRKNTQK